MWSSGSLVVNISDYGWGLRVRIQPSYCVVSLAGKLCLSLLTQVCGAGGKPARK